MSAWRRKLIETFPESTKYWEEWCDSIYGTFGTLTQLAVKALGEGDEDTVERVFAFAYWCYDQKPLNNAVCVGFYENLPRQEKLASVLPRFLRDQIYQDVRPLMESMCGKEAVAGVDMAYDEHGKVQRRCAAKAARRKTKGRRESG